MNPEKQTSETDQQRLTEFLKKFELEHLAEIEELETRTTPASTAGFLE